MLCPVGDTFIWEQNVSKEHCEKVQRNKDRNCSRMLAEFP